MDTARTDDFIKQIYASPHNPTTDDFATMLGFIDPPETTQIFANLDEIEKLIGTCHLLRKLRMRVHMSRQDVIYHKFAALYLPSLVSRFLEPPTLPPDCPEYMTVDFKLNNTYIEMMGVVSHTPYFSKFLRSDEPVAQGGKKLLKMVAERLVEVAPFWDKKMVNPPIDREPGYYQSAAGTSIQLISTLLVIFVKEPVDSPFLINTDRKNELTTWLKEWERRYGQEFLGRVSNRALGQLERHPIVMQEVMQMRRLLKNWEICGKDGCDKTDTLKACSRCKTIRYCCAEHQKSHWTDKQNPHKALCFESAY